VEASRLLDCLRRVVGLRFSARSAGTSGWNGEGVGTVKVETPSSGIVIFRESGEWRPTDGGPLRFSNVYRWSLLGPASLRLEHLRFGPGQPVRLFELAPESELVWSSIDPHECRDDCYSARLQLEEDGISLRWTIVGPRKREEIAYRYHWADETSSGIDS
jgi:hypothetical protein